VEEKPSEGVGIEKEEETGVETEAEAEKEKVAPPVEEATVSREEKVSE
jgi:hypothetical protein